jgi:hypothetical protein
MPIHDVDRLTRRAIFLCDRYDIEWFGHEGGNIYFRDPRLSGIEHVCHEIAHAVLLKIRIRNGSCLSAAVGEHMNSLHFCGQGHVARRNEIETFSVVRGVLRRLGIQLDRKAMIDEACQQTYWPRWRVVAHWRRFDYTRIRRAAVARIYTVFTMEVR